MFPCGKTNICRLIHEHTEKIWRTWFKSNFHSSALGYDSPASLQTLSGRNWRISAGWDVVWMFDGSYFVPSPFKRTNVHIRNRIKGFLNFAATSLWYQSCVYRQFSSPAVVGGLEGGVTQTCALLCLPCRSGRQRATTGTASSVTCRATSCRVTTASGFIISSVCRRSSNPEMEAPTGSVSSAG